MVPLGGRPRPDALVRFAEQFIANASVAPGAGGFACEGGAQVLRRWCRWVGISGGLSSLGAWAATKGAAPSVPLACGARVLDVCTWLWPGSSPAQRRKQALSCQGTGKRSKWATPCGSLSLMLMTLRSEALLE